MTICGAAAVPFAPGAPVLNTHAAAAVDGLTAGCPRVKFSRPMHTALRSWGIPGPLRSRAVERVPAGCQSTHANGDSGRGLSWTLCPVEGSLYLEMHEITFFTSTVTTHNFSEM